MFCPNCGAATEGKFCQKCGAAASPETASGAASSGTASGSAAPPVLTAAGLPMHIASALCYIIPVICPIIFLVVDPYKRNSKVRFDAIQSLLLTVALVVINEVIAIALGGQIDFGWTVYKLLRLAEFILIVFLAFKAFQNEKVVLPGIGPLAAKQA